VDNVKHVMEFWVAKRIPIPRLCIQGLCFSVGLSENPFA